MNTFRTFAFALSCLFCTNLLFAQNISDAKYADLFNAVKEQGIVEIADATPKGSLDAIFKKYKKMRKKKGFDLQGFVATNFEMPAPVVEEQPVEEAVKPAPANALGEVKEVWMPSTPIEKHIDSLWASMAFAPAAADANAIALPNAHVASVAGSKEIGYWEGYFTMIGLAKAGKTAEARMMLDNYSHLIGQYGFVPAGNSQPYLSRSQPPFYALMVKLMVQEDTSLKLASYIPYLEKEYAYWMDGRDSVSMLNTAVKHVVRMNNGSILNRYWDAQGTARPEAKKADEAAAKTTEQEKDAFYRNIRAASESGWLFSSRWLGYDQAMATINTTDLVPVDLNSMLYLLEKTLSEAYLEKGDDHEAEHFNNLAEDRERAINTYCWSAEDAFFADFSYVEEYHTSAHSLAGLFPLFAGICTQDQAFSIAEKLEEEFLKEGGLVCTVNETGQAWDAPNGWAPLHWVAVRGLDRYGLDALADDIATRWLSTVEAYFDANGKLLDRYNVVSPLSEPVGGVREGFGWTNGVYLVLKRK